MAEVGDLELGDAVIAPDVERRVSCGLVGFWVREVVPVPHQEDGVGGGVGVSVHPDRDAALAMHGTTLQVKRSAMPATDEGEFYWDDLVGLEVVDIAAGAIGTVDYLLETGADDVMVIKHAAGGEILVPFAWERVVRGVELDPGRITVDWPEARAGAETE